MDCGQVRAAVVGGGPRERLLLRFPALHSLCSSKERAFSPSSVPLSSTASFRTRTFIVSPPAVLQVPAAMANQSEILLCVEVSRKRPMDCVGGCTLNSQQNVYGVPRRGLIALSICTVTTVCGEGKFLENLVTANAARDDKTSSNVDVMSHTTSGEPLDSKPYSPLNGLFSIFDTTEKTKSGKVLPKGYLQSARQVVKRLKESLKDESGKEVNVRRSADSAKEAIRDYLQNWKGQKVIESEDSYKALEDALKALGKFYAKQGPRAMLSSDVKSQILMKLEIADAAL